MSKLDEDVVAIIRILHYLYREHPPEEADRNVLLWLNTPHPELGNITSMSLIEQGKAKVVANMLYSALSGNMS